MSEKAPVILWFRRDLRIADNPAFIQASQLEVPIVPVFLWTPKEESSWPLGEASQWWLHQSLKALKKSLYQHYQSELVLRSGGSSLKLLEEIIAETGAQRVFWNRCYEPFIIKRDKKIKSVLLEKNIEVKSFNALLLVEPWQISTQADKPYQVFTPFWKALQALPHIEKAQSVSCKVQFYSKKLDSLSLPDLKLEPKIDWTTGLSESWVPGEAGAKKQWSSFLTETWKEYLDKRDFPAVEATSRISPHLHFGEISPRAIWHGLRKKLQEDLSTQQRKNLEGFLRELAWREFAYHLLFHFPHTPEKALREKYQDFPWIEDKELLQCWQQGQTGYPLVDAGMRELWHTGWMHNRVRMIVASFLVKDLFISWQQGAKWFWDTLVDADLANNTLGWQWTAGCGADAAPYFRIFNPSSQAKKFDPEGEYIKKWVPELSQLPLKYLFEPWKAPQEVLEEAQVKLGQDYPELIIDHAWARERALDVFKKLK